MFRRDDYRISAPQEDYICDTIPINIYSFHFNLTSCFQNLFGVAERLGIAKVLLYNKVEDCLKMYFKTHDMAK